MDGDGELQRTQKDDLNISVPCATGQGEQRSGSGDDSNNEDNDDDLDNGNNYDGEVDDDDGDTTDGAPPTLEAVGQQTEPPVIKRRHIQSRRMQEYQQQLSNQTVPRQARKCLVCGHILYSGPGFRYHQQRHQPGNERFTCDNCQKVFKSSNGLKYHLKRKRCRGGTQSTSASRTATTAHATSSKAPTSRAPAPLTLGSETQAERLMVLADIATGPGSPLLRSPGTDSRGSATESFFDDSEKSAAMALSSMKKAFDLLQKRPNEPRKGPESTSGTSSQNLHHKHLHPSDKPKRPMNSFMLFAQKHRGDLNKKYPEMNNRMISTKLSEEWNSLPDDKKQRWKDEARQKAEQHQKEHPDCWKRKK